MRYNLSMTTKKPSTSFRLSAEARERLAVIADYMGISQTDVIELFIRHHHHHLTGVTGYEALIESARLRNMVKDDNKRRKKAGKSNAKNNH